MDKIKKIAELARQINDMSDDEIKIAKIDSIQLFLDANGFKHVCEQYGDPDISMDYTGWTYCKWVVDGISFHFCHKASKEVMERIEKSTNTILLEGLS